MFRTTFSFVSQSIVLVLLLLYGATWMWAGLRSLCQIPFVSSFVRSCDTINSNMTVWAALPLLLSGQTVGMERVLNQSSAHAEIVDDLLDIRLASVDLSILVQSSDLEYRFQLSSHIDKVADDALDLNRGLQHLSAKIAAGFDRILYTNEHLYQLLRNVPIPPGRMPDIPICHSNPFSENLHACLIQSPYSDIAVAYERALQTYEAVLRELIQSAAASLSKAALLDADLRSTMRVVAWERFGVDLARRDLGLGLLWSLLGGHRRRLAHLSRNENILNRVGEYSARSLRYVRTIQDTLEGMERHLEELRLVASGAMVVDAAPPEVILQMLARGFERLGRARFIVHITDPHLPSLPLERDEDVIRPGCYVLRYRHLRLPAMAVQDPDVEHAEKIIVPSNHDVPNPSEVHAVRRAGSHPVYSNTNCSQDESPAIVHKRVPATSASATEQLTSPDQACTWDNMPQAPFLSVKGKNTVAETSGSNGTLPRSQPSAVPVSREGPASLSSLLRTLNLSESVGVSTSRPITSQTSGIPTINLGTMGRVLPRKAAQPPLSFTPMPSAPLPPARKTEGTVEKQVEKQVGLFSRITRGPHKFDHSVRSRAEKVVWYESQGTPGRLTAVPIAPTIADIGELYVHKTGGKVQVWLRDASATWVSVAEQHPHPVMEGYVLRLLDGDPRWVKKETYRTYIGRQKKLDLL
ncbi:uncharacterized protein C8Q71DRAFT_854793 [Rhodofomes roseus]|uniref:Uncharacterized protein n=1 Tax=Rhodofomes roseus TaxID=34475 RepID=A0ABQ8KRI1_9APHY|nr:uncharacterized protein C8Q71DRAFT_854793 [Rhodofomes roseus]KAH9840944.1 hypothetical protein C8Q71DRAFT_854793 [Rhodofomes roseus]